MATNQRNLEIGTGLFVLLGFAALAFLTTQLPSSGVRLHSQNASYMVTAKFDNVGDLKVGAPVTMAGVRIGRVESVQLNAAEFKAIVALSIDKRYNNIPEDVDAAIQTSGLLGAKYVGLGSGGSATFLTSGSQIELTQSALVLEDLVNKLFANIAGKGNGDSK
jgi:phospholipid/cholesterol/gamma-HCH transport system substrate-binding protein